MDPAAAPEESSSSRPHISASKQTRILIWRSEVASALESVPLPLSPLSSSRSSSTTTTTTTGSASNLFHFPPLTPAQPVSRRQRFWRRLSRSFSGGREPQLDDAERAEPARTSMYTAAVVALEAVQAGPEETPLDGEGDVMPGEGSSDGAGQRGLKEKKERLQRAARLLEQGAMHT